MTLVPRLSQTLGQEMLLLPRMLQSIQVLQLGAAELDEFLRSAAEENEALLVDPPEPPDPGLRPARSRAAAREASDRHEQWLESQPERPHGLSDVLGEQLALLELDGATLAWVRHLIAHVDDHGYLPFDDADLIARAHAAGLVGGAPELARARQVLQSLEPRGIGARDAIEALLLQLDPRDPDYGDLKRLLVEFLGELARNKLPSVARAMGLSVGDLKALLARLEKLDPRPARALCGDVAPPIVPEIVVEPGERGFEVRLDSARLPAVALDPEVVALARERRQAPEVKAYLRGQVERARWIVDALEQRGRTLLAIARCVFARQLGFLGHGPGHLAPLRMRDVADELGLHVSTVSRAVAGKHAQTPWGIFALRHFFQAGVGEGEDLARDELQERVKGIFAAEDPAAPLSDDEVVARLAAQGVELARRTVTKYRKALGIASSYRRRRY